MVRPLAVVGIRRVCATAVVFLAALGGIAALNSQTRPLAADDALGSLPILDLRVDCGAAGDGRSDDGPELKACLTRLGGVGPGAPRALHIPAGLYRISGAAGAMPTLTRGATISGDGPFATALMLDRSFAGDLFSWSESWMADSYQAKGLDAIHEFSRLLGFGGRGFSPDVSRPPLRALAPEASGPKSLSCGMPGVRPEGRTSEGSRKRLQIWRSARGRN